MSHGAFVGQDVHVGQACDVSVIVPFVDQRVIGIDVSVRSWAHNQTLAKDRYEVIIVSDGSKPKLDAEAQQFLGPRVRLLQQRGANIAQLLDLGIRSARGTFALVTELHCEADQHCFGVLGETVAHRSFPSRATPAPSIAHHFKSEPAIQKADGPFRSGFQLANRLR